MATAGDSRIEPQPHPHHRKIDIQSPLDLQFLRQNLERSAQQKLDLHFPIISAPQTNGDATTSTTAPAADPMRTAVSQLVSEFISQTFSSAAHSISVNGLDANSLPPSSLDASQAAKQPEEIVEYEPYDAGLTSKLSSLYAELESLTTQVAKLRREAPQKSANQYRETLEKLMVEEDNAATAAAADANNVKDDKQATLNLSNRPPEWQSDIQAMYEHGVVGLTNLTGMPADTPSASTDSGKKETSLTGTVGLVERAAGVARELE